MVSPYCLMAERPLLFALPMLARRARRRRAQIGSQGVQNGRRQGINIAPKYAPGSASTPHKKAVFAKRCDAGSSSSGS